MRYSLLIFAAAALLAEAPVYKNTGEPIRLNLQCSDEDLAQFGMSCSTSQPCPVFLELAAAAGVGERLIVAGNLHNRSVTMYSVLLTSEDGGKSWTEPEERIRFAGLDQIQFLDPETGWITGHILQTPPRDPFFLLTTDGGKHWRRRPVFSDSKVGTIERFWFDSRNSGVLLIDRLQVSETGGRYERHESMTGGENWMIREVSATPIRAIGAPLAGGQSDWRVRAHAQSKSYRIERRSGENWRPVASFLIEVGECRMEERPLVEPTPTAPTEEAPAVEVFVIPTPGSKPPPAPRRKR